MTLRFLFRLAAVAPAMFCIQANYAHAVVTFDWATIGNSGNPGEVQSQGTFGSVADVYRISKHEVTNSQYTEFLNAVDAAGANPNGIYNSLMTSRPRGGIDFDAGGAVGSKYSNKTNMGNKPVHYVSFFDSMRFVNWLENGQTTDGSGTENGVYTIGTGVSETRAASATFFIPSEDEWYKAAFYDPRAAASGGPPGDDNYWLYPTSSDSAPTVATANATGDISNPGANVANYSHGADWNGRNGNVTTVGSAGTGSASFYGTFDQGGNVREWNEAVISSSFRGIRGGGWGGNASFMFLAASSRGSGGDPASESDSIGFRVASVPEPSTRSCDFTGDDICDVTDLDLMQSLGPIATGVPAAGNEEFDLNGDDIIDLTDQDQWLTDAATENGFGSPYKLGDANLDGTVDGRDFLAWNAAKFTSSLLWSAGDFNADGTVDGRDFLAWNANKFTSSDMASVPEPVGGGLLVVGLLLWSLKRTRT